MFHTSKKGKRFKYAMVMGMGQQASNAMNGILIFLVCGALITLAYICTIEQSRWVLLVCTDYKAAAAAAAAAGHGICMGSEQYSTR
jgi:hypothetical protein